MSGSGYSVTARVFFVFACVGAILVFVLAYLLGSRPVDYGTNLQARLTQVSLKLSQCKERTSRWGYKDNKAKRGEASTSDEVAELETQYEKLTASHEECESTSQSLSEGLEKCREDILNMGTLIQDKEFEANATTIARLKRLAKTKDGNVGQFVTQMEAGADVEKKELIRGLLRDIAEKRILIQKVAAACREKRLAERQASLKAREEKLVRQEKSDQDETPRRRKKSSDSDDEAPIPRKKKTDSDSDSDSEAPKKKKTDSDSDSEAPKKKKKTDSDDSDSDASAKKTDSDSDSDEAPKKKKKFTTPEDNDAIGSALPDTEDSKQDRLSRRLRKQKMIMERAAESQFRRRSKYADRDAAASSDSDDAPRKKKKRADDAE